MKSLLKTIPLFAILACSAHATTSASSTKDGTPDALNETYECSLVDDFDDWRLNIDVTAGTLNFFDNDHESSLSIVQPSEIPPQRIFYFEGVDSMDPATKLSVIFNQTTGFASLTDNVGEENEAQYEFACVNSTPTPPTE